MGTAASRWARSAGAAAGVVLAIVLLAAARLPERDGRLGFDLTVAVAPTGELGVGSAGALLTGTGMHPGAGRVSGATELRNQTGRRLPFRVRALPSNRDADDLVTVRVSGGGRVVYEGPLGGLRRWSRRTLVLEPGETQPLAVAAWLALGSGHRTAGRSVDVPLELRRSRS